MALLTSAAPGFVLLNGQGVGVFPVGELCMSAQLFWPFLEQFP